MQLLVAKVVGLCSLLALALIFGTLPYCVILRHSGSEALTQRRQRIIQFFNCFAGGVFLGALFLGLLTEGAEEFESYKDKVGYDTDFPFFNVIVVTGFFLTSAIEYVAHSALAHRGRSSPIKVTPPAIDESQGLRNGNGKDYGTIEEEKSVMTHPEHRPNSGRHAKEIEAQVTLNEDESKASNKDLVLSGVSFSQPAIGNALHSFELRSLLLLLALSFHSIFDGLALGLQDTVSKVWEIFAAVAIHKCIVSFCLGLDVFENTSNPKIAAAWMVIFSTISPIGACIGISLTSTGINETAQLLSSSILQGLACGVFFYVTFLEILNTSWKGGNQRSFLDVVFAFLGFAIMAVAKIWD